MAAEVRALHDWSLTTPTGSRTELPFTLRTGAWDLVCSEGDACGPRRCADREACFVTRVRREAAAARLLIVNHHLLFADLALRSAGGRVGGGGDRNALRSALRDAAVLPGFTRLVFDEAHAIEGSATSYFSERISRAGLERLAARLVSRGGGLHYGLVPLHADWFVSAGLAPGGLVTQAERLRRLAQRLERAAAALLGGESAAALAGSAGVPLLDLLAAAGGALTELAAALQTALDGLDEPERDGPDAVELEIQMSRLRAAAAVCEQLRAASAAEPERDGVRWVEGRRRGDGSTAAWLVITPVEVAPLLRAAVFERYPSVVLTSATLTVGGEFGFWRSRVGLSGDLSRGVFTECYPSPFAYREQVLVGIPNDAPDPRSPGHQAWLDGYLAPFLRASRGRALVLFTSYAMLQRCYGPLRTALAPEGIAVLRQGDADRHRLLRRFPRRYRQRAAGHRFVLGGRGRAGRGAQPGGDLSAAVRGALPSRGGRADGAGGGRGRRTVQRPRVAARRDARAAGVRAPDSQPRRPRGGAAVGRAPDAPRLRGGVPALAAGGSARNRPGR